jgi:hypothetical protein
LILKGLILHYNLCKNEYFANEFLLPSGTIEILFDRVGTLGAALRMTPTEVGTEFWESRLTQGG